MELRVTVLGTCWTGKGEQSCRFFFWSWPWTKIFNASTRSWQRLYCIAYYTGLHIVHVYYLACGCPMVNRQLCLAIATSHTLVTWPHFYCDLYVGIQNLFMKLFCHEKWTIIAVGNLTSSLSSSLTTTVSLNSRISNCQGGSTDCDTIGSSERGIKLSSVTGWLRHKWRVQLACVGPHLISILSFRVAKLWLVAGRQELLFLSFCWCSGTQLMTQDPLTGQNISGKMLLPSSFENTVLLPSLLA